MCGILGLINLNGEVPSTEKFKSALNLMKHRGPDDWGIRLFRGRPSAFLGHRRLSIIDLTDSARQPITDADGKIWLVYNGEIYNYLSLRDELINLGFKFQSRSDSEVIVYAYIQWGLKCLERINGIFAFAIWDKEKHELVLARDRTGVKPLYYHKNDKEIIFASEIKSILPFVTAEIDIESTSEYLSVGYVPWPHTMFKGIKKIPPSHYLKLTSGKIEIKRYWGISHERDSKIEYNEAKVELKRLIKESVKSQLMSDVPVGTFLSGGIDSSIITYLTSKEIGNLKSYTMGFKEKRYDETQKAAEFADWLKITQNVSYSKIDEIAERIPELIWHLDEPIAEALIYPINILSKEAKKDFTVALSGEGADEYLYGYRYYTLARMRNTVPGMFGISKLFGGGKNPSIRALGFLTAESKLQAFESWSYLFSNKIINEMISYRIEESVGTQMELRLFNSLPIQDEDYFPFIDQNFRMIDYILTTRDKMSMAEGLELRVPFLDHKLLEFISSLPSNYKLNRRGGKAILRDAFNGILPIDTIRMKKKPFSAPINEWTEILGKKYLSQSSLIRDGIILQKGFNKIQSGNYQQLWILIVLEIWYRIFISNEIVIDKNA